MSAPTVTDDTTHEVRYYQRTIELEGVEPILLEYRYSHGGKQFRPDKAYTQWGHGAPVTSITLHGPVLKADGTESKSRTSLKYVTPADYSWGKGWDIEAPAWLLDLFGIEATP